VKGFPEDKDEIHNLKASNNYFNHLMERYEAIDKQILELKVAKNRLMMNM